MSRVPDPVGEEHELLHAFIDGACTAEEQARVNADPALRAEAEALRAARDRIRTRLQVAPAPDATRDAHVVAALDAFDALNTTPVAAPAIDEIAAARDRRSGRAGRWSRALPVAAAAAVFLVVVGVLTQLGDDGGDTGGDLAAVPSARDDSVEDGGGDADATSSAEADLAPEAAESATDEGFAAVIPAPAARDYDSLDRFLDAMADEAAPSAGAGGGDGESSPSTVVGSVGTMSDDQGDALRSCTLEDVTALDPQNPDRFEVVVTDIDGRPVAAVIDREAAPRVVIVDLSRCEVVAER